jgi:hypothetical protein
MSRVLPTNTRIKKSAITPENLRPSEAMPIRKVSFHTRPYIIIIFKIVGYAHVLFHFLYQ